MSDQFERLYGDIHHAFVCLSWYHLHRDGRTLRYHTAAAQQAALKRAEPSSYVDMQITANWMFKNISLDSAPRLEAEIIKEHGDLYEGLFDELMGEIPVLLNETSVEREEDIFRSVYPLPFPRRRDSSEVLKHVTSQGSQIVDWPATAANRISRRLYVNRTKTIQLSISTPETRALRSDDLIREWEEREEHRTLRRLILSEPMPLGERQALLLYLSGHTDRQAAERLGVHCGTVKTLLHRARKRLAQSPELRAYVFG